MKMSESLSGKIVYEKTGYNAFIPNPLPPKFEWTPSLINSLSQADQVIGKLAGEGSNLPNPHLLIRPFITYEAVTSSQIEGTQATLGEVLANDVGVGVKSNPDDLQEVSNYIDAFNYGIKRLETLPLSLRLIKEVHEKLMQGVRRAHATPGEFRKTQNWIGSPGCTLTTAKYVPPSPEKLMDCLSDFENFLHSRELPSLIHIALCHYQFEAIHPFLDGNGRVGRLLITLLLIEREILPAPLLYISAFFETTRSEYYRQLYNVSAQSSWEDWLIYFLNGVAVQAKDALSRTQRVNKLISEWTIKVSTNSSGLPVELVQYLAVNPFVTTKKTAEHFGVAFTTAKRAIDKLYDINVLSLINDKKRDRVYCAVEILEILEEPALLLEK